MPFVFFVGAQSRLRRDAHTIRDACNAPLQSPLLLGEGKGEVFLNL